MKKLLLLILLLPFLAKAQVPAVNDTVRLPGTNPFIGQWRWVNYQGFRIPYMYNAIAGKEDFMITGKYARNNFVQYLAAPADTTSDSYDLIQNAITSLNGNGTLILGSGVFLLNKSLAGGLKLPAGAKKIRIIGQEGTRIKLSRNNLRAFDFLPPSDLATTISYNNIEIGNIIVDDNNISALTVAASVTSSSSTVTGDGATYKDISVGSNSGFIDGGLCFFPYANTGTAKGKSRAVRKKSGSTSIIQVLLATGETVVSGDAITGAIDDHLIIGTNYSHGAYSPSYNINIDNLSIHDISVINLPAAEPNATVAGLVNRSPTERQGININSRAAAKSGISGGYNGQLFAKNISIQKVNIYGGNTGVAIYASATDQTYDMGNVHLSDIYHTTKTLPTNQYFSAGIILGGNGIGRDWLIERCVSELSGDVGIETDAGVNVSVVDCISRNAYGSGFFSSNYTPPAVTISGAPSTTTTGSVTSGATTITVAAFPMVAGAGYLVIDNELMYYNYSGTTTLAVTRGLNQTASVSHASGATVKFVEIDKQFVLYQRDRVENTLITGSNTNGWRQSRNAFFPNPKLIARDISYVRLSADIGSAGEAVHIEGNQNVDIDGFNVSVSGVNQTGATSQQGKGFYFINRDYDTGNGVSSKIPPAPLRLRNININAGGTLDNGGASSYYGVSVEQGNWNLDFDINANQNFQSTASNQSIGLGLTQSGNFVSGNVNLKFSANGGNAPIGILMQNFTPSNLNLNNLDFTGMVFTSPTTNSNYKPWFLDLTTTASRNVFFGNVKHSLLSVLPGAKQQGKAITVTATPYTYTFKESVIQVNNAAATVINLPAVDAGGSNSRLSYGATVSIVDISNAAATNNITITPASGEKINNSTSSIVINTNGGGYTLRAIAGGWTIENVNKLQNDLLYAPLTTYVGTTATTGANVALYNGDLNTIGLSNVIYSTSGTNRPSGAATLVKTFNLNSSVGFQEAFTAGGEFWGRYMTTGTYNTWLRLLTTTDRGTTVQPFGGYMSIDGSNTTNVATYSGDVNTLSGAQIRYSTSGTNRAEAVPQWTQNMQVDANIIGQFGYNTNGNFFTRFSTTGTSGFSSWLRLATTADLSLYEVLTNKSTNTSLGTSDLLYPTQKAVKTYVDNQIGSVPTNYITTNTAQTGLTGNKTIVGAVYTWYPPTGSATIAQIGNTDLGFINSDGSGYMFGYQGVTMNTTTNSQTFRVGTLTANRALTTPDASGVIAIALTNTLSSAGTLSPTTSGWYTFSGTTATWTLPTISGNTNVTFYVKNRGSGNLVINSNAGGNDIYLTSATNTITISPGDAVILHNDSGAWSVQ